MPSEGQRARRGAPAAGDLVALTATLALALLVLAHPSMPAALASAASESPAPDTGPALPAQAGGTVPVLAYYFISHTADTWWEHKRDAPSLGRYTSESPEAIREHVRMARDAGIRAFIVHWRSTEAMNHSLDLLVQEARSQNFKLAIHYAALDDRRKPLPIAQVAADLDFFTERWARDPVFDVFGQPLVIVDGTWEFSVQELTLLSGQYRVGHPRDARDPGQPRGLLLLASERDAEGYQRVADVVDGNAYYWSSGDPTRRQPHVQRLASLRDAVGTGLWIAPAAPGFDASLLGATRVIDRAEGRTFSDALQTALESNPDALGVVSWNEYDENTHIEPSGKLGTRALEVLADYTSGHAPVSVPRLDSAASPALSEGPPPDLAPQPTLLGALPALLTLGALLATVLGALVYGLRGRREPPAPGWEQPHG